MARRTFQEKGVAGFYGVVSVQWLLINVRYRILMFSDMLCCITGETVFTRFKYEMVVAGITGETIFTRFKYETVVTDTSPNSGRLRLLVVHLRVKWRDGTLWSGCGSMVNGTD